jgi:hypothetical protein
LGVFPYYSVFPASLNWLWWFLFLTAGILVIFAVRYFVKYIAFYDLKKIILYGVMSVLCIYMVYLFTVATFYECNEATECRRICERNPDGVNSNCRVEKSERTSCPPLSAWFVATDYLSYC